MIKAVYIDLIKPYDVEHIYQEDLWKEIEQKYSQRNRHYHNLDHISALLNELTLVKPLIQNWEAVLFAIYYHDLIYKSTRKDNEEKSAEIAENRMRAIGVDTESVNLCQYHILATKSHREYTDSDTNYFTDADLSILGKDPEMYANYCSNIRKEYAIYPNFLYKKGRQKVVNHFLSMDWIFKTPEFYEKYEQQARWNLEMELVRLST